MENNSYADSGDSSPRSRDIDCENPSWDEQPSSNYKVKFMCSYGGKIQPRPHDNQLTYFGGDTKILAVDRNIKFSDFVVKLSSLSDSDVIFKYQLPGEDLDALISVTNDEDLEHMMLEYDRVHRVSPKPQRLRLFLFPQKTLPPKSFATVTESKPNQQWFVDALNSVPIQSLDSASPPAPTNQDFLFGFDKGGKGVNPAAKLQDPIPEPEIQATYQADIGKDERNIGEPMISQMEIQRQIQDLQRLQIASQEQAIFRRKSDEALSRAFHGDYYVQNIPEKTSPVAPPPATVSPPPTYWPDMNVGAYTTGTLTGTEHPVYLIPSTAGMYQTSTAVQPVTGQVGQGYYAMQRVIQPENVYREQPVYNVGPPQPNKLLGGGVAVTETGYAQVAYDSAGRQVYYTAASGGVMPTTTSTYQTVGGGGGMELRQVGPLNVNQEGKVVKPATV